MLLDQAHRGQGFGPAMQQRLIEHLRGQDDAVLAGTIHAGNVASLASARRAGRDVIATYVWVTPTGSGAQCMPGVDVKEPLIASQSCHDTDRERGNVTGRNQAGELVPRS